MNREASQGRGRPPIKFQTLATPVGKPRWTEEYFRSRWMALRREERNLDSWKGATCRTPGCGKQLGEGNSTGLCKDHIHGYHCPCDRCTTKRGRR